MSYLIEQHQQQFVVVADKCEVSGVFHEFFRSLEPAIEERQVRRGMWPFRRTETIQLSLPQRQWVTSIATHTILRVTPVETPKESGGSSAVGHEEWTFETAIEQIERCDFECEGGHLSNNVAWIWLKGQLAALTKEENDESPLSDQ